MSTDTDITRMYQAAEDWEADVLDALQRRAGITWEHDGCWTNLANDTHCGYCGKPRAETDDQS